MAIDLNEVSKLYDRYRYESLDADLAVDCAELLPALITEIRQLRIELELVTKNVGINDVLRLGGHQ